MLKRLLYSPLFLCLMFSCTLTTNVHADDEFSIAYTIDTPPSCFTQGFIAHPNGFFMSCGKYGQSVLYSLDKQGKVIHQYVLPKDVFAEGIAYANGEITLLTWRENKVFVFDAKKPEQPFTLKAVKPLKGEGWGLSASSQKDVFVLSDGSHQVQFISSNNAVKKVFNTNSIHYTLPKHLDKINELAIAPSSLIEQPADTHEKKGEVLWFNRWHDTNIYSISLDALINAQHSGIQTWNLSTLSKRHKGDGVLNGLSYDKEKRCLWVTGKRWGRAYCLTLKSS